MPEQARQGQVTLEEVAAARQELLDSGSDAGPTAIRLHLGNRGSFTTIQKFLRSLQAPPVFQEQGSEPAKEEAPETLSAVQGPEITAIVDLIRRAIAAEVEVVQHKSAEVLAAAHRDADARVAALEAQYAAERLRADRAEAEVDRLSEAADQLVDQAEGLKGKLDQQKTEHAEAIKRLDDKHAKVSRKVSSLEAEVLGLTVAKDALQGTVVQAESRVKAAEAETARERERGDAEAARERARADQERERVEKLNRDLVELRVSLAEASAELVRLKDVREAVRAPETTV